MFTGATRGRGGKKFSIRYIYICLGEKLRCFMGYVVEREFQETTLVITLV